MTDATRRHRATAVLLNFSGAIDPAWASNVASYRLIRGNRRHRFVANRRTTIRMKAASYDPATHTVTLIPRKPFPTRKPVEVVIEGGPLAGQTEILE